MTLKINKIIPEQINVFLMDKVSPKNPQSIIPIGNEAFVIVSYREKINFLFF